MRLVLYIAVGLVVLIVSALLINSSKCHITITDLATVSLVLVSIFAIIEAAKGYTDQVRANSVIASMRKYNDVRKQISGATTKQELDCAYEQYWSLQFEEWYLYTSGKIDEKLYVEWCLKRIVYLLEDKNHLVILGCVRNNISYKKIFMDIGLTRMSVHTAFVAFYAGIYIYALALESGLRKEASPSDRRQTVWRGILQIIEQARPQMLLIHKRVKKDHLPEGIGEPGSAQCKDIENWNYKWSRLGVTSSKYNTSYTRKHIRKAAKLLNEIDKEWGRLSAMAGTVQR